MSNLSEQQFGPGEEEAVSRTEHFAAGAASPNCRHCGVDPMKPTDPDAMRRSMDIHVYQEHPESPEATEMKRVNDERWAEHEARQNSPGMQAAAQRQQAAHDALQPLKHGPLFHGTKRDLSEGDVITPYSKKIAHAATNPHTAAVFAGGKKAVKAGQGHVYEVEHAGPVDDAWVQQMKYTGNETHHEVVSPHGFRVVRKLPRNIR